MKQLRLLAPIFLVSALALPAAAQLPASSPAPLAATITGPSLYDTNTIPATSTLFQPSAKASSAPMDFSKSFPKSPSPSPATPFAANPTSADKTEIAKVTLLKKNDNMIRADLANALHAPCAKLRTYNFTARDLKSNHPRPSSETDCTPVSSAHLTLTAPAHLSPMALPANPK